MTRLNLILALAVLFSALFLVRTQYESRRLYVELEKAAADARRLSTERERLEVDKRAQATPARVQRIAMQSLHMRATTPATTEYVKLAQAGATAPTGQAVGTASTAAAAASATPASGGAR